MLLLLRKWFNKSYYVLLLTQLLLFSCSPLRTLKPNEFLLNKQTVKGTDKLSRSELAVLYKIETNKKILGYPPLVSVYNLGTMFFDSARVSRKIAGTRQKYDNKIAGNTGNEKKLYRYERQRERKLEKLNKKLKEGNGLMKIGEPPAIYDTALVQQTRRLIQYRLLQKGFFEGSAHTTMDTSGRRINVTYSVKEGPEFFIDGLYHKIQDQRVDSIVKAGLKDSKLKVGKRYEEGNVTAERERLSATLKNNGYFDFSPAYIYFNIDTTGSDKTRIKIQTVILNPAGKDSHPVYKIDSVYFINNRNRLDSSRNADTIYFKGITYIYNKNIKFSKKIIDRKIKIHPQDLYNQSSIELTQRNLSTLDMFRTVAIRYQQDTIKHTLTANILTNTFRKHSLNIETGLSFTDALVPGPFGSLTYRERNVFRGFELLDLNLRAAVTGQAAVLNPSSILRTEEYSMTASVSAPQLYFPGLRGSGWENNNPRTRISAGYSIVKRPEYTRGTARASLSYTIDPDMHRQISFAPVDINIINTATISDPFKDYLISLQNNGNNLIYGFTRSFVSDINATYTFNNYSPLQNTRARMNKYYIESGGTFFNLINQETFMNLSTFTYFKWNTDFRRYFPVRKATLAMRWNMGMAKPYGNSVALPYERYYFAGGPNSIRAWKLRRLGPGSYAPVDSTTGELTYRIERPGELILETSMEYRFKLIGFFEGALFLDAGNIWMLTPDPARPGAEFRIGNFFRQIAVGTGAGLRLNFSFLIVRLDWGIKVYDPAVQKFVFPNPGIKESVLNLGIGYPF